MSSTTSTAIVTRDQLRRLAEQAPSLKRQQARPVVGIAHTGASTFEAGDWLTRNGLTYKSKPWNGGTCYVLDVCPFNAEHTRGEATVIQMANGALSAGCKHSSCQGKGWADLRAMFEPKPQTRRQRREPKRPFTEVVQAVVPGDPDPIARIAQNVREAPEPPTFAEIGEIVGKLYHFVYIFERLYVYQDGVYRPNGEEVARRTTQRLMGDRSTKKFGDEVVYYLVQEKRIKPEALDHRFINVANGLLEPISGQLYGHDPSIVSIVQLPTEWNPAAQHERGERFLDEVMPDSETRLANEEFIGYFLLPDCRFQRACMFTGEGANGKSVEIAWIQAMIGAHNIANVKLQDFSNNRFHAAQLVGKIGNIFADLPREALEESDVFKCLATGDTITIERKFGQPFPYTNTAKLLFSANELPRSKDRSHAFFRRWMIIPFPNRFEGKAADEGLTEKLCTPAGRSYLLRLAVGGLRRLVARGGFVDTPAMKAAQSDYRSSCDSVFAFAEDVLEIDVDNSDFQVEKGILFSTYTMWADTNGRKSLPQNAFFRTIRGLAHFTESRTGGNERVRIIRGIRLKQGYR